MSFTLLWDKMASLTTGCRMWIVLCTDSVSVRSPLLTCLMRSLALRCSSRLHSNPQLSNMFLNSAVRARKMRSMKNCISMLKVLIYPMFRKGNEHLMRGRTCPYIGSDANKICLCEISSDSCPQVIIDLEEDFLRKKSNDQEWDTGIWDISPINPSSSAMVNGWLSSAIINEILWIFSPLGSICNTPSLTQNFPPMMTAFAFQPSFSSSPKKPKMSMVPLP